MTKDIAVGANINTPGGAVAILPSGAPINKKPPYLVTLLTSGMKAPGKELFISLDKPESINGFIQVKGFFCVKTEDEIVKSFNEIISNNSRENIVEMMFPLHRVFHIRSLVFNAVKTVTTMSK